MNIALNRKSLAVKRHTLFLLNPSRHEPIANGFQWAVRRIFAVAIAGACAVALIP